METREEIIDTTTDDGEMAVLVTRPTVRADWPTVLFFIDAPGIRGATHAFASKLAAEGYLVVTPDLHHRQGRLVNAVDTTPPEGVSVQHMVYGWIGAMTDDQIQHDADRALAAAGVDADQSIVTIGFCLGARAVYRRMMAEPDRVLAGAGWHPSFLADDGDDSPHLTVDELDRPLYLGIGDADTVQSIEMHQRFLDAAATKDNIVVEIHPGTDHGYTWPGAPNHDEGAAARSWAATTAMFAAAFD